MKRNIKLLSFLLAVLLAFSVFPVNTVYAVENTENIPQELASQEQEEFVLPDIVPEAEATERGYIGRVKEEEKDNYTFVFKDSENMRTMRVYSHPVKYTDDDGNVKDITLDIQSRTGGGFETKDNNIKTTFGSKLSDGIRLQHENVDIKLIPANKNIAPVLSEDNQTVTYTLDEKTSLEYSLTYTGFKEDIVVSEYTGQTEYEFLLYTNGLTVKEEMGSFYLADSEGNRKANIGDIIIFTADERNNTLGSLSCEEIKPNYAYLLTIHVDAEYLKDEKTVYPIRIDPTLEITSATTEGAIEDVTVYTGTSYYSGTSGILYLGTSNNLTYRILMKFPNLDMTGITAAQITNATVEFRDVMCQSVQVAMECRYYTGSETAWSESGTTTWSSIGGETYVGTLIDTKTIYYGNGNEGSDINRYSFNITNAAKSWADGVYSPQQGFIFKAADESFSSTEDRLKYFGSYNRSDYRTSFTLQYTDYTPVITLNATSVDILEGGTRTLTATTTPAGAAVTWSTSDSTVATVSATGVVTAKKAGSATITAQFTDNGNAHTATCTVYVYIANGVYHIKNMNSNYYLHAKSGSISNLTDVYQYSKYSDSTSDTYRVRQMWKTYYLGEGRYSIRPMHKLDMALDVTGSNVDIYNIGTTDTLAGVPDYTEWTIEWYSTGYVFKNKGDSSRTMQIKDASTSISSTVMVSTYSTSLNCRWSITKLSSPPSGLLLYNTSTGALVANPTRAINAKDTFSLAQLNLEVSVYSGTINNQSVYWYSSNTNVAIVNSNSGSVTGVAPGTATITARKVLDGTYCYVTYNIKVNNNAVIIVPGFLGTELVAGPNNSAYAQGTKLWSSDLISDWESGILSKVDVVERLVSLRCDSNGDSLDDIVPYDNTYGADDTYKRLYNSLCSEYQDEYSIVFFAYDWRLSNAESAIKLNEFINDHNFDSVILVCHSMGGLVASSYLSLGTSQRNKVDTVITLGSPLLGASAAPYICGSEDLEAVGILDMLGVAEWQATLFDMVALYYDPIDYVISNFPGLYETFPAEKYFDSSYAGKSYLVTSIAGQYDEIITTYDDTRERLDSYMNRFNVDLADSAELFHNSLYINGEHTTGLVNTYYIAGYGVETINMIEFDMWDWYIYSNTMDGDGLVAEWSATLGDKYANRTFFAEGVGHTSLVYNFNVINFIVQLINGNSSTALIDGISSDMT